MTRRSFRSVVSDVSGIVILLLLNFFFTGCSTLSNPPPSSPHGYLQAADAAIDRKDWQAAYRLIEDALGSSSIGLHNEAMSLINRYPQIRQAAFDTFSVERLNFTLFVNGERAKSIEENRLSIYRQTIATPEQYDVALHNYKAVFGGLIGDTRTNENREARERKEALRNIFEQEYVEAIAGGKSRTRGNVRNLLESLPPGHSSRKEAMALLGKPNGLFESYTILTWPLHVEGDIYIVLEEFRHFKPVVTHSFVLVFDQAGILREQALVKVLK